MPNATDRGPKALRAGAPIRAGLALLLLISLSAPLASQDTAEAEPDAADPLSLTEGIAASALEQTAGGAADDLAAVESELALTQERIAEIRAEIEALGGDGAALGAQLAAAGQRVDLADRDVRAVEDRLVELFAAERNIRSRLDGHDRSISNLLASLQRISASPPPAIVVDPADALGSARAAMLLGAVLPQLQERARDVTRDLDALAALRADAQAEADLLAANLEALNEDRLRIATVIEARSRGVEWLSEDLLREEAEAQALADRATSIGQVIEGLEMRIAALAAAGAASRAAQAGETVPVLDAQTLAIAFADAERTEPAVPIAAARGHLTAPANGVPVQPYGASDGFGGTARGLSLATSTQAEVVAPADGWVVHKGPYLNYGEILILNAGQDYTIVLAGLDRVDVERGDFVQMGAVLGVMGTSPSVPLVAGGSGAAGPTLYIELREGGVPIDPSGWWSPRAPTQQGGTS